MNIYKDKDGWGDSFAWIDAGDNYQGTWDSENFKGMPALAFFKTNKLKASTFGNHEFDKEWTISDFLNEAENAGFKYVLSNVVNKKTTTKTQI